MAQLAHPGAVVAGLLQTAPILLGKSVGLLQQGTNPIPYGLLEMVRSYGVIAAHLYTAIPVSIGANTTIQTIVTFRAILARTRNRLAIEGISTLVTDRQPLQQPAWSPQAIALALAVLGQLSLSGLKNRLADQCRYRHLDPLLPRHRDTR